MHRLYVKSPILFYVCLLGLTFAVSCSKSSRDGEEVYVDQEFTTLCEGFEAIIEFAVDVHLTRSREDMEDLRLQTYNHLSENLNLSLGAKSTQNCEDLEDLYSEVKKDKALSQQFTKEKLYVRALKIFATKLDPHSAYFTSEEKTNYDNYYFQNKRYGSGVVFESRLVHQWHPIPHLIVDHVFPNSPAWGAIQAGDEVRGVNQKALSGKSLSEIAQILQKTSSLDIISKREDREKTKKNIKLSPGMFQAIPIWTKKLALGTYNIAYIRIYAFTFESVEELKEQIQALGNFDGWILDLTQNQGGGLSEAIAVSDLFLEPGELTMTTKSNLPDEVLEREPSLQNEEEYWSTDDPMFDSPGVVMFDPTSASASEIVVAALQRKFLLIGLTESQDISSPAHTFGKATAQRFFKLGKKNGFGGFLKLTISGIYQDLKFQFSHQYHGIPAHISVRDPLLAQVLARKKSQGDSLILYEPDYGENVITLEDSKPYSLVSESIRQTLIELHQKETLNPACKLKDTKCQKTVALETLQTVLDIGP